MSCSAPQGPSSDSRTRIAAVLLEIASIDDVALHSGERLRAVAFLDLLAALEESKMSAAGHRSRVYRAWIDANPHDLSLFAAYFNLGTELARDGNRSGARWAYGEALTRKPDFAAAAVNLGLLFEQDDELDEALALWESAVQPDEARAALLNHRGRLLEQAGRLEEAALALRKSLLTNGAQPDVIQHWVHLRQKMCQWPVLAAGEVGLSEADLIADCGPLAALALTDRPAAQTAITARWIARKTTDAPARLSPAHGYGHRVIRLGYLSSDFCRHAMGYLIAELLEQHDRGRFQVHGYCIGRDDGSDIRSRIVGSFDRFVSLRGMPDEAAAHVIAADEIDVLIDLNGLTLGARPQILRWRPAPIQASYLGFIGPVPLPELDYLLCDTYVIPPATAQSYHPKPLPIGPIYQANDNARPIGPRTSRHENGLPEDVFVFCSFSNHYKVTSPLFSAWMAILKCVPSSVLWLAADNPWSQRNLLVEADRHGVAAQRIIFADRVDPAHYISRLALADLYLDTFPYNAGTVASDVIRMGLPMVTLRGEAFASRMAARLLAAVDAEQGIADDVNAYVDTAVALATDKAAYTAYRVHFGEARWRATIGNTRAFVQAFEKTLIAIATQPGELRVTAAECEA